MCNWFTNKPGIHLLSFTEVSTWNAKEKLKPNDNRTVRNNIVEVQSQSQWDCCTRTNTNKSKLGLCIQYYVTKSYCTYWIILLFEFEA